jgi:hypothetical protein
MQNKIQRKIGKGRHRKRQNNQHQARQPPRGVHTSASLTLHSAIRALHRHQLPQ